MAIKPKGKKVTGTKKKDKITWTSNKLWKKALTVKAGAGNDVINFKKSNYKNTLYGDAGDDKIYGGKKTDKIYGGKGKDKLYGYGGDDVIKGGAGNDYIDGGAGNDKIYGESGTNTLIGGAGNDVIYSGSGSDKIYYSKNSGNDVVYNSNNKDTIVFRNIDFSEGYDLGKNGNDLIIYQGADNHNGSVTLKNYFTQNASTRLNKIYFEKSKQTAVIPEDLSYLDGGSGDDHNIVGDPNGGTKFIFYGNEGDYTISTGHGEGIRADVIKFYNNTFDQLAFDFDGVDGLLQYGDYVIRIKDFLASEDVTDINNINILVEDESEERCRLTDLYQYNIREIDPSQTTGTDYSDSIGGTDLYADYISGGLGNDTLCYNSLKNDTLDGGEGANLYEFTFASSEDENNPNKVSVYSISGKDTIYVHHPTKNDFVQSGSDLVIKTSVEYYTDSHAFVDIYLKDWFNNPVDIQYNDSSSETSILDKVSALNLPGVVCRTGSSEYITGSGLIIGGSTRDVVWDVTSASTIFGGAGGDELSGSNNDDLIYSNYATVVNGHKYGNFETNALYGGNGNDTLVAYGEDANLRGESGDDTFRTTLSNNVQIADYRGTNTLYIDKPIDEPEERAYLVFDVGTNGKLYTYDESLFILNKYSYDYWLSHGSFENAQGEFGGIILNCSDENLNPAEQIQAVHSIYDSRGYSIYDSDIYALSQVVAGWLGGTGLTSVSDVIQNGTEQQRAELIAIFDNFNNTQWIQANG